MGFNCYTSSFNSVKYHAFGQTGAKASHYLSVDTSIWNQQFRALSPDIVFVNLGTNNRAAGQTVAAFKSEMHNLVLMLRRAKPKIDICLIGQVDLIGTFGAPAASASAFNDVLRQLSIEDTLSYFDTDQVFGSYSKSNASGSGYLQVDGIHPSVAGGFVIGNNILNSMPPFNRYNLQNGFLNAFGSLTPVNSSGQSANRLLITDASGNVVTNINFTTSGGNSLVIGGNISSGNLITAPFGLVSWSPPFSGGALQTGGAKSSIGYFGFSTGQNNITSGYSGGIRHDGNHSTIRFQQTNQGAVVDQWLFENFAGVNKQMPNNNSTIIRINQGVESFNNNLNNAVLKYTGEVKQLSAVTGSTFSGFWFEPTTTSLNGIRLIGFRNSVGDNYLNTTSGGVAIGLSASTTLSAKLEVSSTTSGFLPPRMTSTQRDAISSPATGLTLYCTDCTATDASTGVMQTYNGTTWKNNW